jgi:magnesium-transporting ATPase (P-type)
MRITPYKEVQRFSQVRWLWFVLIAVLIVELLIFIPEFDKNENNAPLLLISLVTLLLPLLLILFVFKFELRIDEKGIHYRFIPKIIRWKTIPVSSVESFKLKEKESWFEKIHYGFHRNIFKNIITINITGSTYLVISLRGGGTLKLGTENANTVAHTLKNLLRADLE